MKKILVLMLMSLLILFGCSSGGSISSDNTATSLSVFAFNKTSVLVTQDSYTELKLELTTTSDIDFLKIAISSSNAAIATISPTQCVLSNDPSGHRFCEVIIRGVANGVATITASSSGYTSAISDVTVQSDIVSGSLSITPTIEKVTVGSVRQLLLSLDGSSGVSNLEVNFTQPDSSIATITPDRCVLSSGTEHSCTITINGIATGSTTTIASAIGYNAVTNNIEVVNDIIPGVLYFDTSNIQVAIGSTKYVALSLLGSSGVSNVNAKITASNQDITVMPGTCTLSSSSNLCILTILGVAAGSTVINASANDYSSVVSSADVVSNTVPGILHFSKANESIVINSTNNVVLSLDDSSGVSGLNVTLTTSNQNVSVSPSSCVLSSGAGLSSCNITLTGNSTGSTTIIANATDYTQVSNVANVISAGSVPGVLEFAVPSEQILVGESIPLVLSLVGSSNVSDLDVMVTSSNSSIAAASPVHCTLSTTANTCILSINGIDAGSATISAAATKYTIAKTVATVTTTPGPGYIVFNPTTATIAPIPGGAETVSLSLVGSSGVKNLYINLASQNTSLAQVGPGFCCLSSNAESNSCIVNVTNAVITPGANPVYNTESGTTVVTATPQTNPPTCPFINANSTQYQEISLPVTLADPVPESRTLTFINNCESTVWFGISGGAAKTGVSSQAECPSNTTYEESAGQCFWNNPLPSGNNYQLNHGQSASVTIPSTSLYNDVVWSGGVTGRLYCNDSGVCQVGACPIESNSNMTCQNGQGFASPSTLAEFTLLSNGTDSYDVTLITGITVATSMTPTNAHYTANQDPYNCGNAGATYTQTTAVRTLNPASWQPNPTTYDTTPAVAYNIISGNVSSNSVCLTGNTCAIDGQVCGYTFDSVSAPFTGIPIANRYKLSCGTLLTYITADGMWKLNPDTSGSNTAPFSFYAVVESPAVNTTPYANSNLYTNWQFYECPNPPLNSGYQESTATNANACGATNWIGVASPTENYIWRNDAWTNQVYPRIKWVKETCPTCYSFPFDDPSSSFICHHNASTSNPANNTNYTITFCPNK